MNKKKFNHYYHVYILISRSGRNLVKVGKANNLSRVRSLSRMGYAGRNDWQHMASFPTNSNGEAIALESLIGAKLANQGYKLPRISWKNLINGKASYADECFSCSPDHAISVAEEMATLMVKHVSE